jgi:hypothetical protein
VSLSRRLVEALWQEILPLISKAELDPICEVQLFGYFPALKLSTMFGSTFLEGPKPVNLMALGPSFLLVSDELPAEKTYFVYLVVRERMDGGIRISYLLPYMNWTGDMEVELFEVEFSEVESRDEILDIESKIPGFADKWLEGAREDFG